MKPDNFDLDYKNLIDRMSVAMDKPEEDRFIITDGVMNPDNYFSKDFD